MNRLTAKPSYAKVIAIVAAFLVVGGGTAALAASGAARGPSAEVAKKKSDRRVGAYEGTTELGGTVSFRITRKRYVVDFTMPDVPVECVVNEQGNPNPPRYSKGTFTITPPPMKLQGVARFLYEDPVNESGPFQGIHVDGKPDGAAGPRGLKGNAAMISWNGPARQVGTEECFTPYVDWRAKKVGKKK